MRRLALALLLVLAAPAAADTQVRDAPWRLVGIAKSQRTLHVVYEGGGCLHNDGNPTVDTSVPGRVTITIKQTQDVGPGLMCPDYYAFLPLDVDLGGRLAGRRVRGGPRMASTFPAQKVPRLVGLRRSDAVAALKGQGLEVRVRGARSGVVKRQSPAPGSSPGRVTLRIG